MSDIAPYAEPGPPEKSDRNGCVIGLLAAGGLSARPDVDGNDEGALLAAAFDEMAGRLDEGDILLQGL